MVSGYYRKRPHDDGSGMEGYRKEVEGKKYLQNLV
jgi:hypothetical protein